MAVKRSRITLTDELKAQLDADEQETTAITSYKPLQAKATPSYGGVDIEALEEVEQEQKVKRSVKISPITMIVTGISLVTLVAFILVLSKLY